MPIEFTCPSCHRPYRVKDGLAGRSAKCGKCGRRMRIPQTAQAKTNSRPTTATKPAAPSAQHQAPPTPSIDNDTASWLEEELESSQPALATPKVRLASCPSCGTRLPDGAVLCVTCGYDTRTGAKHETRHELEPAATAGKKSRKPSQISAAGSLLRGTLFSFIAAVLGAIVWAVLAYLTMYEFGIVAWALGGLVGFGMALGHEDGDGTFAGIIAAFMSLFGIIAAKVLIIVIFVSAAVAAAIGSLEFDENANPIDVQREVVALALANDRLEREGVDLMHATEEQRRAAMDAARAEIVAFDEQALERKLAELNDHRQRRHAGSGEVRHDGQGLNEDAPVPEFAADPGPGLVGLFFQEMFSPIDGLFILLAFFTAYKVGSGQMTD